MEYGKYRKFIVGLTIALLGWASVVVNSEPSAITSIEWQALGVAFAVGAGVYEVPND